MSPKNGTFIVVPNPCGDQLTLWCNGQISPSEISILDVLGREVMEISITSNSNSVAIQIDITSLTEGDYMLLARASNGSLLAHLSFMKIK